MNTKSLFIVIGVAAVLALGFLIWGGKSAGPTLEDEAAAINDFVSEEAPVKEFAMTSFYEMKDGKPAPQFSLKEITVNKGDRVRIKVTNTKGAHDFTLNEYNIFKETPLNEEVTIEFTADKAGEFVYYCAKMNHRELGQWGTLKVLE